MIELLYFASQIQCGAGGDFLNVKIDVYQNQELVETMMVDDRVLLPVDSVNNLSFEYSIINNTTECTNLATPTELILAPGDELPNLDGFDQQSPVASILSGLDQYQELFLVELGTTDTANAAFDMQDGILIIDNNPDNDPNPYISTFFAD
ncbi:MAG: hypothetical protein WBM44_14920 [Waterburya sp.]